MYDVIGDIHGHAEPLKKLLTQMGYQPVDGVWQHGQRKALFVGDYIDRGPQIRETLQMVKSMTDAGTAIALMGNHEYNALAYHHPLSNGNYLRHHTEKNTDQHAQTLAQFALYPHEWQDYLHWFYTLPLFFEQDGLRAVHACWDDAHINWFKAQGLQTIHPRFLVKAHDHGSEEYKRVDETLKGKEVETGKVWFDKYGHPRTANRLKWWFANFTEVSFNEALFNCPDDMKEERFHLDPLPLPYPADAPPVFCGHYWLEPQTPRLQSANVACLDYSVAKGGHLTAYRWQGEKELCNEQFVWV